MSCSSKDDSSSGNDDEQNQEPDIPNLSLPISDIDYESLTNWYAHAEKVSILSVYDLNVSVVDKNLNVTSIIEVPNNSRTNTGIDVFFVHPTILSTTDTEAKNIPFEEQPELRIGSTIIAQGGLLSKYGRVFAPKYRQSTGVTYGESVDKNTQAEVIATSYSDVKAAFLEYMDSYNNGNKIILAGHSQGSYLLSMLIRDVFDNDSAMQNLLLTAALGGMGYVYSETGNYVGGQFENIALCTEQNECGCIHNWRAYKTGQEIPEVRSGLPLFNENLVDYGLYNRILDIDNDWCVQDETFYTTQGSTLRYIGLNNVLNIDGVTTNFVAFDDMYTGSFRRDSNFRIGLGVTYQPPTGDLRPNDLLAEENDPLFSFWGYHTKDYHIYVWALMEQIDAKLVNCQ